MRKDGRRAKSYHTRVPPQFIITDDGMTAAYFKKLVQLILSNKQVTLCVETILSFAIFDIFSKQYGLN